MMGTNENRTDEGLGDESDWLPTWLLQNSTKLFHGGENARQRGESGEEVAAQKAAEWDGLKIIKVIGNRGIRNIRGVQAKAEALVQEVVPNFPKDSVPEQKTVEEANGKEEVKSAVMDTARVAPAPLAAHTELKTRLEEFPPVKEIGSEAGSQAVEDGVPRTPVILGKVAATAAVFAAQAKAQEEREKKPPPSWRTKEHKPLFYKEEERTIKPNPKSNPKPEPAPGASSQGPGVEGRKSSWVNINGKWVDSAAAAAATAATAVGSPEPPATAVNARAGMPGPSHLQGSSSWIRGNGNDKGEEADHDPSMKAPAQIPSSWLKLPGMDRSVSASMLRPAGGVATTTVAGGAGNQGKDKDTGMGTPAPQASFNPKQEALAGSGRSSPPPAVRVGSQLQGLSTSSLGGDGSSWEGRLGRGSNSGENSSSTSTARRAGPRKLQITKGRPGAAEAQDQAATGKAPCEPGDSSDTGRESSGPPPRSMSGVRAPRDLAQSATTAITATQKGPQNVRSSTLTSPSPPPPPNATAPSPDDYAASRKTPGPVPPPRANSIQGTIPTALAAGSVTGAGAGEGARGGTVLKSTTRSSIADTRRSWGRSGSWYEPRPVSGKYAAIASPSMVGGVVGTVVGGGAAITVAEAAAQGRFEEEEESSSSESGLSSESLSGSDSEGGEEEEVPITNTKPNNNNKAGKASEAGKAAAQHPGAGKEVEVRTGAGTGVLVGSQAQVEAQPSLEVRAVSGSGDIVRAVGAIGHVKVESGAGLEGQGSRRGTETGTETGARARAEEEPKRVQARITRIRVQSEVVGGLTGARAEAGAGARVRAGTGGRDGRFLRERGKSDYGRGSGFSRSRSRSS
ncbi:unnamed protein product, partial [Discosporangium mesarthrocarpum]